MKIIYNSVIPFKGFIAINLFGILFVRTEYQKFLTPDVIRHEKIHTEQIKEMGYIFFYIWYVIEFLVKLIMYRNYRFAYLSVSFEEEACDHEDDIRYLDERKSFAWTKYLKR